MKNSPLSRERQRRDSLQEEGAVVGPFRFFMGGGKIGFYTENQHKSLCYTVKKSYICFA